MKKLGSFDYVVVGAGSAGCVLANRLSEDPNVTVALLEAGGKDDYIWIHIPVGYLYCMGNPRTDWGFQTEPDKGLNGRALNYPRGRVLGGCSSINGMIYMRGQARDYDQWRQFGNTGWGWDDVLHYFKKSEDQLAMPADEFHGEGGEWRVEKQRLRWDILDAFRDAAAQAGLPLTDDFNRGNNEGVGYFQVNQRAGWRWSTAKGFLKPARGRANLTVFTHAQVKKLNLTEGRVTGAELKHGDADATIDAEGEMILCAGSVGSPQIMEVSGIGRPDVLGKYGIEVKHALQGVGENLQDHLQIRCIYKVSGVETLNEQYASLLGKAKIGLQYALFRKGPMTMAPSQLGAFTKSSGEYETPNIQYHVQPLSLDKFGEPLHPFPAFTASVCNLRPESRGSIHIKSADPMAKPAINLNYLTAQADRKVAADSIRMTRKIIAQPALQKFSPEEFKPGPDYMEDEALASAAGDIGTTIFHPVGTCKMGNDNMAVVDERLQVRGVRGLRVIDASVMPTITSGNTNSPTIMIAEKGADMIREDARP
ncbi:GMC family oxidoreductase N-terminal domain-containing protein [Thalassospiraceae bacterium LMO-JJ14]|nr:GMC family oxidoreductase N-terminal domain-containing protein [Thalassospiraceae bacterium LMO-JJ14]